MTTLALQPKNRIAIGVVGYSAQKFDSFRAMEQLVEAFTWIEQVHPGSSFEVISGLTDMGIPAIAYRLAFFKRWRTVGVACAKARDYKRFPVDHVEIVGENWGDESKHFIGTIDVLVRVGGGKQSHAEVAMAQAAGITVHEYELATEVAV